MSNVRHFHRCLESQLPELEEVGWLEWGRDHVPSLPNDPIVLLEWSKPGEPKLPDAAGKKDDSGKRRHSLIPTGTIRELVEVLTDGAKHYGDDNWQRVPDARRRYYDAAMRHLEDWWTGTEIDPQSGRHHLAHAAVNILFLLWFARNNK